MNESIKDKLLKEHALNDDDLEKVSGGDAKWCPVHKLFSANGVCPICSKYCPICHKLLDNGVCLFCH